jgi:hypothetical protein
MRPAPDTRLRLISTEALLDLLADMGIKTAGVDYMDNNVNIQSNDFDGYMESFVERMRKQ